MVPGSLDWPIVPMRTKPLKVLYWLFACLMMPSAVSAPSALNVGLWITTVPRPPPFATVSTLQMMGLRAVPLRVVTSCSR